MNEEITLEIETRHLRLWPLPAFIAWYRVAGGRRNWILATPWGVWK